MSAPWAGHCVKPSMQQSVLPPIPGLAESSSLGGKNRNLSCDSEANSMALCCFEAMQHNGAAQGVAQEL